jgi:hypothetical protein
VTDQEGDETAHEDTVECACDFLSASALSRFFCRTFGHQGDTSRRFMRREVARMKIPANMLSLRHLLCSASSPLS